MALITIDKCFFVLYNTADLRVGAQIINSKIIHQGEKIMAEFASKGVAGTGLGLGIAGTALGLLTNNGLGGLVNRAVGGMDVGVCSDDRFVNRYELNQANQIAELRSQIALRDANTYIDQKLLDVYKFVDGELKDMRQAQCDKWAAQGIINAKFESATDVLGTQVASINNTISALTKIVIPNYNVCPGWGNVNVQSTGCGCINGFNGNI